MKLHLALCAFLVGCVADPPTSLELGETEQFLRSPGDNCTDWECGSNSPIIPAGGDFWDLPTRINATNSRGYKLTFFGKRSGATGKTSYQWKVEHGILKIFTGGGTWSSAAADVIGQMWRVEKVVGGALLRFEVVVTGIGSAPFTAKANGVYAGPSPRATTYRLMWREYQPVWVESPTGTSGPVPPPSFDVCGANPDTDGQTPLTAVLFEGEEIDADAFKVVRDGDDYVDIGCAGHTLAKMHLSGHTKASAFVLGWPTPSLARRTALMKALGGDYCGRGDLFTYAGAALLRRDNQAVPGGGYRMDTTTTSFGVFVQRTLEARWNERGAICLNTPRVDFRPNASDEVYFPGGVEAMLDPAEGWCTAENPRPPPCTGTYQDNVAGAYITTVNWGTMVINPL